MNEPTDALLLASISGVLDPGRDLELAEQLKAGKKQEGGRGQSSSFDRAVAL